MDGDRLTRLNLAEDAFGISSRFAVQSCRLCFRGVDVEFQRQGRSLVRGAADPDASTVDSRFRLWRRCGRSNNVIGEY